MNEIESYQFERGLRIGNAQRQAALAHVERMLKSGHLDGEEAGKRANTITNAKTEGEIKLAVSDLPKAKPPWSEAWKRFDWSEPKCFVPVLLLTSLLSVTTAFLPFILATAMGWFHNSDLMNVSGTSGVIIGIIGLAFSLGFMFEKLRN